VPLRSNSPVLAASIAVLLAVTLPACVALAQGSAAKHSRQPGDTEIARAMDQVKADPNLASDRTIKTLQWRESNSKPFSMPSWLRWIGGLFVWIAQSSRMLMWGAIAVLVGIIVVYLIRMVRSHGLPHSGEAFVAPTHVRDLDIRPESLPKDIGAASRALWDRGEHRAALALLYRGMLSRLAHVHRVPIRDSSTEGDCLVLAAMHLEQKRSEFASHLVRVWQRAVYGRENIPAESVYLLCNDFASMLDEAA
jgi:hypothetical protein